MRWVRRVLVAWRWWWWGGNQASGQRRHGELRETLELSNKRREEELQRDYAKRRATELDLLESAHKREMDAAAAAAETRLQKARAIPPLLRSPPVSPVQSGRDLLLVG